jgi:phasin family protein
MVDSISSITRPFRAKVRSDFANPRGAEFQERHHESVNPQQITAVQKANLDALFGLTNKAFEGFEKLVQLNVSVVKSTLAEIQDHEQKALSVKDPQELLALQASLTQPFAGKVLSYGRRVYELASSTQTEFAKVAQARCEARSRRVQTLIDDIAKNAPTGSEAAVAVMQSAITAANTAYETVHKATQQAAEFVEGNFNAASAAAQAARQGVEQTSRAARK